MPRLPRAAAMLLLHSALALGLAALVLVASTPPVNAQTRTPTFKIEAFYSGLPQVYEGAEVRFRVAPTNRATYASDVTVEVEIWEPNLDDGVGNNPSLQTHRVTFPPNFFASRYFSVTAYVDGVDESAEASHVLKARLVASSDGSYALDAQNEAEYTILDPPANVPRVSVSSDSATVAEGDAATFTLTRTGDTTSPLTVQIDVEDESGFTRGDFWDAPPALPTSVEFEANSSTAVLTLQTPDDHRDIPNGPITVEVESPRMQPSVTYLPGHTGTVTSASTTVIDNDTAQELELNFGKEGVNDANVREGDNLAFVVKRRQQDANTGVPARFTVRIETNRSGDDWRLEDWVVDTGTGRLYKDFPLQLAGSDLQLKEEFLVTTNGQSESNWDYWASIRPIEDHAGDHLTSSDEAQYWTVKSGFRETTIDATDSGQSNGSISIDSDVLTVTEGQAVIFTLYRIDGPMNKPVTVRVQTTEPNRQIGFGNNPSTEYHNVTIEAWRGHAEFIVYPYVDGAAETGADQLIADIISISQVEGANRYTEGLPNQIDVEIDDPPSGSAIVTVAANPTSIVEGGSTTVTFSRTGGDTAQPLTVDILVDDPDDRLRGNHWDPAPAIPTEVTFPANSTTHSLTLTFPDDQRDLESAGLVKVFILPGTGYYLGQTGNSGTFTTLSVTDNDTAQELSFRWGRISPDSVHWEEGESYLTCDEIDGTCTPGPAEGTFYYEDDRSFVVSHELTEPHPAHFLVSRRAEDTGKTATFVVRVEHNRGWESPRHSSWPIDPETGNRYQEFPLTLTGNQRQVIGRIEVLDNGILDHHLWNYSAEIKQIEDAADGTALSTTEEAQYWTVNGDRKKTIWPDVTLGVHIKLKSVTPKELPEGDDVTITLERNWGNPLETYTYQVRTWEPNQRMADGTNPTEQVHDVVFPAAPMTDLFVEYVTQTVTLTVATLDDSVYEPQDTFMAGLLVPSSISDRILLISTKKVRILDDDRPTIALSVDDTSITEGDTATFTLTRGNNTANELIVGVSVDDPGGFLEGNYAAEAVEVPSSVTFAPGEAIKEVTITPPDDWRDIPDNAFTFTVAQEPDYDIVGSSSLTVQVADNDVAPLVSISFNHAEVEEGNDLVLEIRRIGEDKNPLEIAVTAGPVGDLQYHVFGMDAGISLLTFRYSQPDDSYKGPDHHYEATLNPGRAEFWVPASTATVTGAIVDNDPYIVGVEAYRNSINEGNLLDYRIFHNGHTGEPLQVRVNHSENGNAVYDSILGNQVHTIPAGTSYITPGYITHRNDGYDGDAEFTVELLADDAYEINDSYQSGTIIVRNSDPLPVLGFRDTSTTASEGDGTVDIWVDMLTALPSLLTTTVEYSVHDHFTGDGLSVTQSSGTLTFEPGETSAAITVEILQNSIAGYKERFHVVLSNPVNAALQDGVANLIHDGVIEDDESLVTLEAQSEAVDEGSDVILTLTRDGDTTNELTVWLQVAKTAPHAENRQDTVVFPAGDATVEHTVTTTDDGSRAGSHTVTATLLDPPAIGETRTYWRERPSSVTVTVRDTNLETVALLASTLRVTEGESISLELTRSGRSPITVTLEVTETGDYTTGALPETVTFASQQANATITIPTQNDSTAEDVGKLTVTLVDGENYRAGWPNSHTFTIYDDDGAKPSVSVTRDQAWVNEGQPVSFTVTRSTPTDNALQARLELNRVRYRVTQADLDDPTRGITTPEDHIHFDTEEITVDFPAGTRTVTVTRQTTDDSLNYGNSTYHATVLNDADDDYVALYNSSAKIWVQDDDIPTVTGSSTTSEFFDGFDEVVLPFSRTGDTSGRLLLDAEITHVTHWPAPIQDETSTREEVKGWRFDPGDPNGVGIGTFAYASALGRSGTLELQSHYCPDNPAACGYYPQYQVGTPSSISYNYHSRFMGVRITRDSVSVGEGDSATFTLYRHGGKPDSITRPLQVNVMVTQKGEYISGAAPQTVTFAANQATTTLSVPTTDDGVDELDGNITAELQFTGVGPASCPSQDDSYCYRVRDYPGTSWHVRSATIAVTDDDYVPPDVSVSDASAGEADGTIEFTVTLDRANNERAASVDWTTAEDGSTTAATGGVDFTAASGTLNFAIGETEKTVTVSLLDDQSDEADETFNVVLSNPSELTLADDTGTGTILDDDIAYGIAFSQSTFHTEEGDDVLVSLQRLVPQETGGGVCYVTIGGECFSVATEGDTANGAITVNLDIVQVGDFMSSALPTTVTFAQGVSVVDLTLATVDDSTVEADGSLSFNILQGAGYTPVYIGPPDSHDQGAPFRTLYLYDNDLAFSIGDAQAGESAGQLDFTVSLNAAAAQEVTVDVATADGEATSHGNVTATSLGQDFEAKTETLIFSAGEQTKTFSVVTLDDTIHERNETFTAHLSKPTQSLNRYNPSLRWSTLTSLADGTAVGTIDDDDQALVASVSRAYSIVNENQTGPVRFTVELSHPSTTASERNPAVGWRTVPGTAALGTDYQGANGKLTFMPGQNTGFIDLDVVDDNLFESLLETFSVELVDGDTRLATISPTEGSFEVSIRDNETLTASISADAVTVAEGNDVTFTVTLAGGVPANDVNVPFETSGTATVTDDYAAPKGAITFPPGDSTGKVGVLEIAAGESSGTITFPVLADGTNEGQETLKVEIFSASTDQRAGSVSATENVATTRILDQDNLVVSIQDAPSVTEGGVATFTITLSAASDQDVSAGWSTKQSGDALDAGESALPDKDYAAASGTVAIPAGDRSATFTVTTTGDTLVENTETLVVVLEEATLGNSSPAEMVPLGVTKAEGTIIDDDTAPTGLTISSVSHSEVDEDAGATDITVTVALDGSTQFTVATPVTVEFIDRPGVRNNATLGVDYTATTANVTIPAGESSVTTTITITPVDDNVSEDDEIARLSVKSTAFAGSVGQGLKIVDNDVEPGQVVLTVTPDTVSESASSLQLTVTGTLAGQSSRVIDTVVSLELEGDTATAGEDFQTTTATLTIPAGEMSATATMTLEVLDDDVAEGNETLEVTGTVPGTIVATPADVVIEDDDQEPTSISLLATTGPIGEGGGAVTIPVRATLLGGGTRGVDTVVALSVLDVSATVTDDYTAAWDSSTLTIPAGEYSATANLTLTPVDDSVYEGDEQIAIRGQNTTPGLPVNGVRLTIVDNDPKPTTVVLSLASDTVVEGAGIHFPVITATLEGDSTLTSDVNFNVNLKGDTQRSQSYSVFLFTPLLIEAGESSGTATVWLSGTDDDVEDDDETVTFEGTTDHPDLMVVPTQLTIANDDTSGVRVSTTSLTVREGQRQHYRISLATEPTANVVVTIDVPANAGFTVNPGSITFTPQSWGRKYVSVEGTQDDDSDDEPAAEITHSISSGDSLYRSLSAPGVLVTVRDDDDPLVEVSFGDATYDVDEGETVDVTITLSVDPERPVTIPVTATDQDGASSADYSGVPTNVTFASGETEKTVTITAVQDTENDDGESVKLGFGTLPDRVTAGTTSESTVTITDDDVPAVKVSFGSATYNAAEGESVDVTVVLDADPERTVIIPIDVAVQGGASSADYSNVPAGITFDAGDTEQTFAFAATQDDFDDDGESVKLTFGSTLPDGVSEGSTIQAIVTITDDDTVGVTISETSLEIEEGDSETYTVVLDTEPAGDVMVAIGGFAGTDVTLDDSTLTFTTGNWDTAQTVTVTAEQDDDAVNEEVVNITHAVSSSVDNKYDGLAVGSVPVTVTDDDTVGVAISETSLDIEEGDSDTYTVVLDTEPTGNVTVTMGGISNTDLSLNKTTLTFTTGNWDTAQEVTVTAEQDDDAVDEAVVNITHTVTSTADSDYDGLATGGVAVTVTDDDTVGVTISENSLEIEEGNSDTYTVVLDTEPTGNVTVTIGGTSDTDVSLNKTTLTFTTGNWDTAQEVTVTAEQDDDAVDEAVVNITHTVTSTADSDYDGLATGGVAVTVTDDDTVGVTISENSLEIEEGNSDTYTVVLDTEPTGNVTVTIGGTSDTDVSLNKTTLTFTTGNWDTEQTVRVTAEQDDDAVDEDVVNITHAVSSSADADYDGVTAGGVAVTVADDEVPSLAVTLTMEPPVHGDTDGDGKVNLGDTLRYTAVATNSGNVPLENVNVKDALINTSGTECDSLPIGATCTSSVTYTIVQADVEAGSVSNTATASADGVADKTVTRETAVDQVEELELEKSTTLDGFAGKDESIPYSYKVTNTGTVALSGTLEINDDKIASGDITCPAVPSGGLAAGSFLTCTGSYTTVQADVDAGKVTNEATASLGGVTSGSDSVTVNWQATQGTQPQLTVGSGEDDEDAGSFTFTVTLNPSSLQTVTVDYATSNGTATSGADYTSTSGTLTFSPGDTTESVTVTITDDDVDESDETFNLTLTDAVNASIPIPTGTFTIRDDDTAGVTLSDTSLDIDEGDSDTYTVVLDSQPTRNVTITVNDPSNTDVTADPADLTFTPTNWDTAQTVTVSASQDSGHDDEDGTVTHTAASTDTKYDGISIGDVMVSVTDDEDVPVTVSFGSASYSVAEGHTVTIKVMLSADPERTVEVPITATTMNGADTTDYSGVPPNVVFNSGDTEKTFDFEATQDTVNDDGEAVRLTFGTLPARVTSTGPSQAIVSITDDDVPSVTVSFEQDSYTIAEGHSVAVKVVLSAQPERAVEIRVTATYLDNVGSNDFSGAPTTLSFGANDTEKILTFSAYDDSLDDDGERVRLNLANLPAGVSVTSPSQTVVSITDDDDPLVTVGFEQAAYTVDESDDANTTSVVENQVSIKVTLSADPERTVTIPLTKTNEGGATAADYSGVPANVVFNSGDTEQSFTFTAEHDAVDDDGESVKLGFGSSLPARVTAGTPAETTISITDDDVPSVTVSFEQSSYTVAEGSSETVKVKLSADPERTVTIPLTRTNQGGASNSDYSVPANVVFNSGDTEKTLSFSATQDTVDDDGESVKLGFGNSLPTGVTKGTTDETTISITDDDVPSVTVSFEQSSYTVAEGNSETVKVTLSADPERTVTIPLLKVNQGGASSSDYSGVPSNVVFNSGDTEKTFDFEATDDAADDDGESVRISFGNLPDEVSAGTHSGTTVSITDDDVPSVTVSFEQSSYTVAEGNSETVKVTLSADPERTVEVPITVTDMDGATSSDYSIVPQTVEFNSGDTEKTITFSATDDAEDDDGERVRLNFGALPSRVSSTSPSQAVVSITDDDVPSVTVSFEQSSYTVAEGNSEMIKVTLSADPERTVTIPLTRTNQGGASNSDYSVPNSVVFNSGDTEKTLSFSATQDTVDDDGESVKLGFGNTLPTGVTKGATDETTISITDDDVPSVTVSFEQSSYTVAEGSSETVKVTLSADPERTVTIPLTRTNQGGASNSDYSVPSSVVFNAGDTEKTLSFSATQDTVDDDGESVKLGFGNTLPTGVTKGATDETTISITDDDVPSVTVSFEQSSYTVAEGNSVMVKVTLSADPERTVTIPLTRTNQGGASNSDYSVPSSVVFNAGDTEKTLSFSATQDAVDDDGESVKLGFGNSLPTGVTKGSTDETTISITDDDVPSVTVSFEQSSYIVAEGSSETVKVKLSADPERTVTIPLTRTNQGGASNSDYSIPSSVVFNSGDTEKTLSFSATQDTVDDDGESVKLGFGNTLPTGVTKGTTDETTVSITDDDVPSVTVSFEQSSYVVAEGSSVMVKVTLSADPERTVTIPLTRTNQGGASNSDYSVANSVVFNAGDTEKTLSFSATQDTVDDDGESVKLGFGNTLPTGVTKGATDETTISIRDDDVPSVTVSFEQDSYTVAEGNSETVKVKLSADPERTVTIPLTRTNQGGASNSDYSVPSSVVFNAGDTEKTLSFSATQDTVDDDGESVKLGFGNSLPTGVSKGTTDETTISITDDDVPSVTVSFEQSSYTVAEGNSETVKVKLSADPERTVTIPLTSTNQGGASNSDYSVPSSVVFNSGDTEKTLSFSATQDTVDDDGESVKLSFGNSLPTGVTKGTTDETTISITDDDVPSVTVSFEQSSYTVAEGSSETIKVKLSADPERTVEVPITVTDMDGASSSDYSLVPQTVVFNSGDTEKTITFSATDDAEDDDGERVRLNFGALPSRVSSTSPSQAVVSITDDDVPSVTVSFEQSSYTVAEGSSESVKVTLSADPERMVTIPLTRTNQGGASNSDYSFPSSVVFDSGDTEKTLSFSATQDAVDDDGESVKLSFGNSLPTGVTKGTTDETTVSITDDDVPSVTVSFEQSSYTVAEGSSETVKVKLSADPERTVEVPITVTDMDGASSSDYSIVPQTVVFNSGDTEKTITFSATDDAEDDDGERVRLNFGALPSRVTSTSPSQAVVSITDDDVPSVTVSFEQSSYTVAEGSSESVKVTLSADPERMVTIPLTRTNQGGASNSDYSVPNTVVFNSGDTEKTLSFSATQDTVDDDGESVKLGFGNSLPTGVTKGSTDETTVSITDDDVPSVTVSFEQSSYTVAEGSSETVKVTLSADPERTVTIPLTRTNQGGASNSDYTVPSSVVFNSGDTEKTLSFSATQDTVDDDGESVKLGFGNSLPTSVTKGATDETTISITDDDLPSVTASFEQDSYTVAEGNSVVVTITLSADPERTVTIPLLKVNQGGASSSDYSGVPPNVVFNSGDTEKTFDFDATDDAADDDGESVRISFGNLPGQVSAGSHSGTTVSITDDDVPSVTVSFGSATYSVDEGESVIVTVTLSADPERTVTIPLTSTNQGGATSADYTVPSSVVFNSGDTEKTFELEATDDEEDDDDESVKLTFGGLPTAVSEGTTNQTEVSINDNDGSGGGRPGQNKEVPAGEGTDITVSFEHASYNAREGSTATVKVILSADPQRSITIPLTATSGTGLTSGDYSGVPASLDFTSGETEKSFILTAVQDQDDENDETLTLGFGTLPVGLSDGDITEAVVTIVDSVRVSFGASSYEAYEGGVGAQVIVKLDSPAPEEIIIPITATGKSGATSADWTGVPSNLTFASGDTQKTFIVMAYDDDIEDDGEKVELGFGNVPAGVAKGSPSVATVELMNMEVPTCETAVWCADVEFADSSSRDWKRLGLGLGYHTSQEPYLRYSSLSDNRFTFRGKEYQVWSVLTTPGTHPDLGPGSPGRIPEYSTLSMHVMEVVQGKLRSGVDRDHLRDWTLYIDGIALPFTETVGRTSGTFFWNHSKLQDLYADWTDGDTYEIMIAEDPVSERPAPPVTIPTAPMYLRVIPGDRSLIAQWKQPLKDGNSDITHYRIQWKLGAESWSNPNAVEEATVQPFGGGHTEVFHMITGLGNYTLYTLRVIAVNGVGHSEPSDDHFGMPQRQSLDIIDSVVNGNQLTITYERTLDGGSVPSRDSFRVLVNGGPRKVTGISISGSSVILTLEEPAKRAIRATDEVEFRYITPPSGTPAVKDTLGNYAYSCYFGEDPSKARNVTDRGLLEPVRAEFTMAPASHDGPGTEVAFRIEFSEPVRVDIGRNHAHLLEVEGGRVTSAWWLNRDTTIWEIVLEPDSNDDVKVTLPAGRDCGAPGAPCGSGGRRLTNQPDVTIPGPSSMNSTSNSPATGGPAIVGTPQTGQTLTATTTGIQDQDGMSGAAFTYQWIRHDLETVADAEIIGATGKTYTVIAEDEGKAVKVKVTFTDDAGNEESLTSFAVIIPAGQNRNAEPTNSPATGSPGIEGSPVVGQTLTATTSGIADDDGISKAVFTYQWLAGGAAIGGATASTYTVVTGDVGKALSVKVAFSDDEGNVEAVVSDPTGAVEAAPADDKKSDDSEELTPSTSLTAEFQNVPGSHDGETTFTLRVSFSEDLQNQSGGRLRNALSVTGADVIKVRRVDKQRDLFEFTVTPTETGTVTVSLDAFTGNCADDNAVCTADGEALSGSIQTQIAGP